MENLNRVIKELKEENKRLEEKINKIESKLMVDDSCQKMLLKVAKSNNIMLSTVLIICIFLLTGMIILLGSR